MTGKAQYVDVHLLYIYRKYTCRLGSIHDKQHPMTLCNLTNPFKIHKISRKIRAIRTYNCFGIRTDRRFYIRIICHTSTVTFNNRKLRSFFLKLIKRSQYRIMFHHCSDHMISRLDQTFDCNIKALCRITGKYHLFRAGPPKHFTELLPGVINYPGSAERCTVSTSARIPHGAHRFHNCIYHFLRLMHSGCCII